MGREEGCVERDLIGEGNADEQFRIDP
jgi:hypothetical protein